MSQQVIDGILYSPVNAHALRKGDLVRGPHETYRLAANWSPVPNRQRVIRFDAVIMDGPVAGTSTWLVFAINERVFRAVGASVGGLI